MNEKKITKTIMDSDTNDRKYITEIETIKKVISHIENQQFTTMTIPDVIDYVAKLYGSKEKYFDTIGRTTIDEIFDELLIRITNIILYSN